MKHKITPHHVKVTLLQISLIMFLADLLIVVLLRDFLPPPIFHHAEALSGPLSRWAGFSGALGAFLEVSA